MTNLGANHIVSAGRGAIGPGLVGSRRIGASVVLGFSLDVGVVPVALGAAGVVFAGTFVGAATASVPDGVGGDKLGGASTGCSTIFGGCAVGTSSVGVDTAEGDGLASESAPLSQFNAPKQSTLAQTFNAHARDKPAFIMVIDVPEPADNVTDSARDRRARRE